MHSQKIFTPRPHHGEQFCFRPPPPGISMGVLVIPPTISNFCNLSAWLGTLERTIPSKMLLHYIIMQKIIFSCDKMRTNLTIHVNTVSNNLKDFLS